MAVHFGVRGQRLKTDDNIAYIAYIMVLISILAMAARQVLQGILISISKSLPTLPTVSFP